MMDLLTEKAGKKKHTHFILSVFPKEFCHITDRNTVCNSVGD